MIAFIIALRHPESTNNYALILKLLDDTLRSLLNQTDDRFCVYIGCNETPDLVLEDERISFCTIDCPIPSNRKEVLFDKGVKRAISIQTANSEANPDFFFLLDADDLLDRTSVAKLNDLEISKTSAGYWLERGYLLDIYNQRIQEKCGFNRFCGSSLILNSNVLTEQLFLQKSGGYQMRTYSDFINGCSSYILEHILGNHTEVISYMESNNLPLKKLTTPMVCWRINTGENESRTKIPPGSRNFNADFLTCFSITSVAERRTGIVEIALERYRFFISWVARLMGKGDKH
tara:strand:- start:713 stop:1579 length:867 start_codon:yes stop_codon:yes gene_type:complete